MLHGDNIEINTTRDKYLRIHMTSVSDMIRLRIVLSVLHSCYEILGVQHLMKVLNNHSSCQYYMIEDNHTLEELFILD